MRDVDYKLVMCGKGPESKKISKLIKKYGLEDRVDMRGWVSEEEKLKLMSTCRFFVMPSIYEAYGLAALEALSYGKPIVCTDVDGLPGNVKDAGYYVKPKDSVGLAEAINKLLSDAMGSSSATGLFFCGSFALFICGGPAYTPSALLGKRLLSGPAYTLPIFLEESPFLSGYFLPSSFLKKFFIALQSPFSSITHRSALP